MRYLLGKKIIDPHQHGFFSRKSTTTQLLECNLDWNVALNSRKHLDIIYLDYAKACDSVVHVKLLAKLSCYGLCDQLIIWIKNFLIGRTQYVKIDEFCSSMGTVISRDHFQRERLGTAFPELFLQWEWRSQKRRFQERYT